MGFEKITIANKTYQLNYLSGEAILEIAKLPKHFNEAMLTKGLQSIIGDSTLPLTLTTQERYAIYLKYLLAAEDHNISHEIDIAQFLNPDLQTLHKDRIEENGMTARCLTGFEAEILEQGCQDTVDWILGAMVLQVGCDDLPPIENLTENIQFARNIVKNRLDTFLAFEQPKINKLLDQFFSLERRLNTLVNITYDKGIVLNKFGGTDDAPTRFRINAAITGVSWKLFSIITRENAAVQP